MANADDNDEEQEEEDNEDEQDEQQQLPLDGCWAAQMRIGST